jgi:hypothetical protein
VLSRDSIECHCSSSIPTAVVSLRGSCRNARHVTIMRRQRVRPRPSWRSAP